MITDDILSLLLVVALASLMLGTVAVLGMIARRGQGQQVINLLLGSVYTSFGWLELIISTEILSGIFAALPGWLMLVSFVTVSMLGFLGNLLLALLGFIGARKGWEWPIWKAALFSLSYWVIGIRLSPLPDILLGSASK